MILDRRRTVERRKGPDLLLRLVNWTAITGWLLFIAILFMLDKARPPMENFFDRLFGVELRKTWDENLLSWSFGFMLGLFVLCLAALLINKKRHRRRTDRYNPSVIILLAISFAGCLLYLIRYVTA